MTPHSHKILNIAPSNPRLEDKFSKELVVSKILSRVLVNRGIKTLSEAQKFLNINAKDILDPFLFSDMRKAVGLLKKARENKDKVMVCGDYDADGITSLALLKKALINFGLDVTHYLPHRINDGYGLNEKVIKIAKLNNIKIIITVDCGISNHKEVEELRKNGVEVIITDHHEPAQDDLPCASSIINPKVEASGYSYRDLAGVGAAYKLAQAVSGSLLLDDLDLVSLGTIADSAPLTGENRIFASLGLAGLAKTKNVGLSALIESADAGGRKMNSTFISFILGPRINASGRMDTAETSLKLLMSNNQEQARELAKTIEAHNRMRQKVESKIMQEAQDLINKEVNFKEHKVIVIAKEGWHQGVLGIVASKLADRFYRPAIVISLTEGLCKGSARSIKNFNLFGALLDCKGLLYSFGGHAHAAGLLIASESIEEFKRGINRLACERLALEDLLPSIDIDMEIKLSDLNEEAISELAKLEPFGKANPEPLFYTKGLKVKGEPLVLSRDTLKFWVTDGEASFQAIGFGMGGLKESVRSARSFDLVYTPRIDSWQGESSSILEIKDLFLK